MRDTWRRFRNVSKPQTPSCCHCLINAHLMHCMELQGRLFANLRRELTEKKKRFDRIEIAASGNGPRWTDELGW